VNAYDWRILRAKPFLVCLSGSGLLKPKHKILRRDIAGRVEAVGRNVKQFQPDDEVFGTIRGGFAEYVCAREEALVLKPANLSFEEAAAVPMAAVTALQGLRDKGQIQPGQISASRDLAGLVGLAVHPLPGFLYCHEAYLPKRSLFPSFTVSVAPPHLQTVAKQGMPIPVASQNVLSF